MCGHQLTKSRFFMVASVSSDPFARYGTPVANAQDCTSHRGYILLQSRRSPALIRRSRIPQHLLLVEDNPSDLRRLTELIRGVMASVDLVYAACLADALEQLQ